MYGLGAPCDCMGIPHVRYDLSYCTDLHSYDGGSDTDHDVTVVHQKVPQRVVTALQVCDTRLDSAPPRHCLGLHHVTVFVFITSLSLSSSCRFVFITSLSSSRHCLCLHHVTLFSSCHCLHHVIVFVFITSLSLSSSRHFVFITSLCLCLHRVTVYLFLSRNCVCVCVCVCVCAVSYTHLTLPTRSTV